MVFWQCRHCRVFVPATISCGLHSQGRHDSKSSMQSAHPVFWSCIWSTWIIELLAILAGVTFVVVSRRGLSQHWATVAIDQRQTGDRPLCSFFTTLIVSLLYHPCFFYFFVLYSWSLLSSNFVFHRHFSVKLTFICTYSHSPFVSLLPLSPLSICLCSSFHLLSLAQSSFFHSAHLFYHLNWITDVSKSTPMLHAITRKHLYGLYLNLVL